MVWLLIIIILCVSIFIFTHLDPLNIREIEELGSKRRSKQIKQYFSFNSSELCPDYKLKQIMNPKGSFYNFESNLNEYPSKSAALLKYKKHEWITVAFEKDKKIGGCWLNKGVDRSSVGNLLSIEQIMKICAELGYSSVLISHNHPNRNPSYHNCTKPSPQDIKSAQQYSGLFNQNGINLLEFVCERGRHYEYFRSIAACFVPIENFIQTITHYNGISKYKNLLLHLERIF